MVEWRWVVSIRCHFLRKKNGVRLRWCINSLCQPGSLCSFDEIFVGEEKDVGGPLVGGRLRRHQENGGVDLGEVDTGGDV